MDRGSNSQQHLDHCCALSTSQAPSSRVMHMTQGHLTALSMCEPQPLVFQGWLSSWPTVHRGRSGTTYLCYQACHQDVPLPSHSTPDIPRTSSSFSSKPPTGSLQVTATAPHHSFGQPRSTKNQRQPVPLFPVAPSSKSWYFWDIGGHRNC